MDDRVVMADATRWLYRVLKAPTAEERSQAAAHLLTLFDEQYAAEPGDSLFAALAERFGLPAVPRPAVLAEPAWLSQPEPAHHRDSEAPCAGCGARWQPSADGRAGTMAHAEDCPWLASQDAAGETSP